MSKKDTVEKEIQEILNEYGMYFGYNLTFPVYKILPDEVKLALKILETHGMHIIVELKDKKQK